MEMSRGAETGRIPIDDRFSPYFRLESPPGRPGFSDSARPLERLRGALRGHLTIQAAQPGYSNSEPFRYLPKLLYCKQKADQRKELRKILRCAVTSVPSYVGFFR